MDRIINLMSTITRFEVVGKPKRLQYFKVNQLTPADYLEKLRSAVDEIKAEVKLFLNTESKGTTKKKVINTYFNDIKSITKRFEDIESYLQRYYPKENILEENDHDTSMESHIYLIYDEYKATILDLKDFFFTIQSELRKRQLQDKYDNPYKLKWKGGGRELLALILSLHKNGWIDLDLQYYKAPLRDFMANSFELDVSIDSLDTYTDDLNLITGDFGSISRAYSDNFLKINKNK